MMMMIRVPRRFETTSTSRTTHIECNVLWHLSLRHRKEMKAFLCSIVVLLSIDVKAESASYPHTHTHIPISQTSICAWINHIQTNLRLFKYLNISLSFFLFIFIRQRSHQKVKQNLMCSYFLLCLCVCVSMRVHVSFSTRCKTNIDHMSFNAPIKK